MLAGANRARLVETCSEATVLLREFKGVAEEVGVLTDCARAEVAVTRPMGQATRARSRIEGHFGMGCNRGMRGQWETASEACWTERVLSVETGSVNGRSQRTGCTIGASGLIDATLKIEIISKETPSDSAVVSRRGGMSQVVYWQGFAVASQEYALDERKEISVLRMNIFLEDAYNLQIFGAEEGVVRQLDTCNLIVCFCAFG